MTSDAFHVYDTTLRDGAQREGIAYSVADKLAVARLLDTGAPYWSNRFKCNVSYISPNSIFCLLEKDGEFIKVLSTNGELGWIYLADLCKNNIEEVKV